MAESNDYAVRGQRVAMLSPQKIKHMASNTVHLLNIKKSTLKKMDVFIDGLWKDHGVNVNVVSDDEWIDVADAWCDPVSFTISIPEKLYIKIVKFRDLPSIHILFHELGHMLLGHKAVLHHATTKATKYEDSEWQADYFADVILETLGEVQHKQLSLF